MLLLGCFVLAFIAMAESLNPRPLQCIQNQVLKKVSDVPARDRRRFCVEFAMQRSVVQPDVTLFLHSRKIRSINYDALDHLGAVLNLVLVLDRNVLSDTDYLAHVPSKVVKVSMRNNIIRNIIAGDFQHLQYLSTLDLSYNQISILKGYTLRNFNSITQIDLSFNDIQSIQYGFFQDMKNIRVINLAGNPLPTVFVGVFFHLVHLTRIDWGDNMNGRGVPAKGFANPEEYRNSNRQTQQLLETELSSIPCSSNQILQGNISPRKRNQNVLTKPESCPKKRRMQHY